MRVVGFALVCGFIGLLLYRSYAGRVEPNPQKQIQEESAAETPTNHVVNIKEALPDLEFADTPSSRAQGLSDRAALSESAGLFFVFEESDRHGIWMKDMRFPIDIIWLNETGVVVGLTEGATSESFPESFYPASPARYVLETNIGFIGKHGLKLGDVAEIPHRP